FVEMLEAGYTAVAEFHYLHHAAGGEPYANRAEMSERMIGAARRAGIGLTLLLTLYEFADFGGAPVSAAQQRFVTPVRKLVDLHGALERRYFGAADLRFGFAPHSLRAVSPESFAALQSAARDRYPRPPMHVHAAEQQKEVEDCVAWRGARPVAWLLEHADRELPWTFVHATHVDASEVEAMAQAGIVAALCPTTEANLGDGIFPAEEFVRGGGRYGVGSDSGVTIDPFGELRWLEYSQRWRLQRRSVVASAAAPSLGESLFRAATSAGPAALGRQIGAIEPGYRADFIVTDRAEPAFVGVEENGFLDALIFNAKKPVRDVYVAGERIVAEGRHRKRDEVAGRYRETMTRLRKRM
ncbi:MAG: formimidoylglutamate deiminase, partial [Candidatus Eremiobacteraeota bacterium]|nr:formimidoylglutamate deiminase [Candidatus Eremiobacteraeota bacterium]